MLFYVTSIELALLSKRNRPLKVEKQRAVAKNYLTQQSPNLLFSKPPDVLRASHLAGQREARSGEKTNPVGVFPGNPEKTV